MPIQVNGSRAISTPKPGGVARVGRAEDRQEQERPLGHAPERQCHAEIGIVVRVAPFGRHVEDAKDADRRVDQEAHRRVAGAAGLALQDVVGELHRRADVGQHVMDAVAHRPGTT